MGRMFHQTDIVRVCSHLSAMQVAHSWNSVKNDLFSTITLEKSSAGRGRKMRYLWCRFNFWGQFCDIKFFPLLGPRYGRGNFRSIFVRIHHDHQCLNLNNSKIWRRIPEFIWEIIKKTLLSRRIMQKTPETSLYFLAGSPPLKTRHSTKVTIFEAPFYKLCKGLVSQIRCIFQRV